MFKRWLMIGLSLGCCLAAICCSRADDSWRVVRRHANCHAEQRCDARLESSPRTRSGGNLLFDRDPRMTWASTQVGRNNWPAVENGYALPDYSVYQEFYYDMTGNRFNERNYPQRTTWGYRVQGIER